MNQKSSITPLPNYLQNMGLITKRDGKYSINSQADNLHLIFHRLVPQKDGDQFKRRFLEAFCEVNDSLAQSYISKLLERQKKINRSYAKRDWQVLPEHLVLHTSWRMIVGLGGSNVLETSMTLHPLYGFPYIPASAVKGIAHAFADQNNWQEQEKLDLFGTENKLRENANKRVGKVVFFDALPKAKVKLDVDIMNPHYGDYYKEDDNPPPPGDWLDPNPIFFLTTAASQAFCFLLAARDYDNHGNSGRLLARALDALTGGLTSLGAGAKTSAGYGYFNQPGTEAVRAEETRQSTSRSKQTALPKDAVVAEIVDSDKKPAIVKIVDSGETTTMGGINLAGLGLVKGSLIYVEPNMDRKSKKIQSVKYIDKKQD